MINTALVVRQKGVSQVYSDLPVLSQYAKDWIHLLENTSSQRIHQRAIHSTFGQVEVNFPTKLGPVSIRLMLSRPAVLSEWVARVLQLTIDGHEDMALKEISPDCNGLWGQVKYDM